MKRYAVTVTLTEPMLGTVPLNQNMYREWVATRNPDGIDDDEVVTVPNMDELIEKGTTGFHRLGGDPDGQPFLYDYVIKGHFKAACGALRRASDSRSAKLRAYRKVIDGMVFVEPRRIPIEVAGPIEILERPLRTSGPQGERVALARSQMIPAGSTMAYDVIVLGGASMALIKDWLDYGQFSGYGQWRNASYGRFVYTIEEE